MYVGIVTVVCHPFFCFAWLETYMYQGQNLNENENVATLWVLFSIDYIIDIVYD